MNKRLLPLLLLPVVFIGVAATYTITQLTENTTPSAATLIEIYDPSASPKSGKYLLSNLEKAVEPPRTIAYNSSLTLNLSSNDVGWVTLNGTTTLASAGLAAGYNLTVFFDNVKSTNCEVILPSGWRLVSGARTNILAASAIGILSVYSRADNDTNVIATWASE